METFDSNTIWLFVWQITYRLPFFIVYAVGIILSLLYFGSYPKTAIRSGIGFVISLATSIISIPVNLLPFLMRNSSVSEIGMFTGVISFSLTFIGAIGCAFVLWAVWTKETSRN